MNNGYRLYPNPVFCSICGKSSLETTVIDYSVITDEEEPKYVRHANICEECVVCNRDDVLHYLDASVIWVNNK